jgi:hypothetical protein
MWQKTSDVMDRGQLRKDVRVAPFQNSPNLEATRFLNAKSKRDPLDRSIPLPVPVGADKSRRILPPWHAMFSFLIQLRIRT